MCSPNNVYVPTPYNLGPRVA